MKIEPTKKKALKTLKTLNVEHTEWDLSARALDSPKNKGKLNVCDIDSFVVKRRIGSPSVNGRVYKIEDKNSKEEYALKIFRGVDECKLATKLGEESRHFPKVYTWSPCPNVILDANDTYKASEEYHFMTNFAVENHPGSKLDKKRLRLILSKMPLADPIKIMEVASEHGVSRELLSTIDLSKGIPLDVMASELLFSDINQMIFNLGEDGIGRINNIVAGVFPALVKLSQLGYVHKDLHLGNVLVRKSEDNEESVIHDFGETVKSDDIGEHVEDVNFFFHALLQSPIGNVYEEIIQTSMNLLTGVGSFEQYWGILETIGAKFDTLSDLKTL